VEGLWKPLYRRGIAPVPEAILYTRNRRIGNAQVELSTEEPVRNGIVNFEWDPRKAATNESRHSVSFHEAATVLGDPLASTFFDPDHSEEEHRFLTIGMSSHGRLLIVAHSDRGAIIRIISARELTARERKQYEEGQE
jgi:uncharacterized protein